MRLPSGAAEIVRNRENGMAPADPVIVSLVGRLPAERNAVVVVSDAHHDWRFLVGLKCFTFVSPKSAHVQATLRSLARLAADMWLWDVEAQRGCDLWPVWRGLHVPEVHGFLPLEDRRDAIFLRWARCTWFPTENRRFVGLE